jgi:predicted GNAT superfamily acetyltransferase
LGLAMAEPATIRELSSLEDSRAAAALLDRIWGGRSVMTAELLRAMGTHGGLVLGAFRGEAMVGAQMGFVGLVDGRPVVHSHVTGVIPEEQGSGVGFALKLGQRDWCLARDIDTVTWTFDPLIARNARFNLHKLGAVADRFLRDFYGPMDDAFNVGERTDRLEVRWELRSPRVEAALAGRPPAGVDAERAVILLDERDGQPMRNEAGDATRILIRVPSDYQSLRSMDPNAAKAWRDAAGDALEFGLAGGFQAVDFQREGAYVLEQE